MSSNVSPELTGGEGFSFEDGVVATYLTSLLTQGGVRGLKGYTATSVSVQRSALGYPLDDLIVEGMSHRGEAAKLSLQVKSSLTISSAATNADFRQVVSESMRTLERQDFRVGYDRVGGACKDVSSKSFREAVKTCEWARSSVDSSDFFDRLNIEDFASDKQRVFVKSIRKILVDEGFDSSDEKVFELLRHFVLMRFDVRTEGAADDDLCVERLRFVLTPESSSDASKLWQYLLAFARDLSGRAGSQDRKLLLENLCSDFKFESNCSFQRDFGKIQTESLRVLRDIQTEILGVNIPRQSLQDKVVESLGGGRVLQIQGPPGTGKSALLKMLAERQMDLGTVWVLKSDRLVGPGWTGYSNHLQLQNSSLKDLLIELAVTSQPVLFVDGIDRIVESGHQKIILDILHEISEDKLLHNWRIVTSLRDGNIEYIRTWLPEDLLANGRYDVVRVENITDEEALFIAGKKPALRPLLIGSSKSKDIARRPFFLSVLSKTIQDVDSPHVFISEIDLLRNWWKRGGYDATRGDAKKRQQALCEMAQIGADKIGRKFRYEDYDPDIVQNLLDDGVVSIADEERSLFTFSHDIFFEWSFFYVCMKEGDNWLKPILDANESPHLARTVELISQFNMDDADRWRQEYIKLESASCRNQWQRMWLVAPFGSAHFYKFNDGLFEFLIENNGLRFERLLIWFKATKSLENKFVVTSKDFNFDRFERMRFADEWAWPNDFGTWYRFISWCLTFHAKIPNRLIQDYIAVLHVWQNGFSKIPNTLSKQIVELALSWLSEIESRDPMDSAESRFGGFYNRLPKGVEYKLRIFVLQSREHEPEIFRKYLNKIAEDKYKSAFEQIIMMSDAVAQHFAPELVDLCLAMYLDRLPEEILEEYNKSSDHYSYPSFDMDFGTPGLTNDMSDGGVPSPIREPFGSLFKYAPDEGIRLIRSLLNHATKAWRQVCKLSYRNKSHPIPITLTFSWGEQKFWGTRRSYLWFRGAFSCKLVGSGLMALEEWAFSEVEKGRSTDDVIHDLVKDNESIPILGVAVSLALESNCVSEVALSLITCQRLWEVDVRRLVEDKSPSNTIGLPGPDDERMALLKSNERKVRLLWMHNLVALFSLTAPKELYDKFYATIAKFTEDLPYWYEEEIGNEQRDIELKKDARYRVAIANRENYAVHAGVEENQAVIHYENPRVNSTDFREDQRKIEKVNQLSQLVMWSHLAFETGNFPDEVTTEQLKTLAMQYDSELLFLKRNDLEFDDNYAQKGVAGAAAAILNFGTPDQSTINWAVDILGRSMLSCSYDDFRQTHMSANSIARRFSTSGHPAAYAARGLHALVNKGIGINAAMEALLNLAGHPNPNVANVAISEAVLCWDCNFRFAWIAICLGVNLSIKENHKINVSSDEAYAIDYQRKVVSIEKAIAALNNQTLEVSFPDLPEPWIVGDITDDLQQNVWPMRRAEVHLENPDPYVDTEFLINVLKSIPLDKVLAEQQYKLQFVSFVINLIHWTLRRVNPHFESDSKNYKKPHYDSWPSSFGQWLASYVIEIGECEIEHVESLISADIEVDDVLSLLNRFADFLVALGVIDSPEVNTHAIELLSKIIDRISNHSEWQRMRHDPSRIYRGELLDVVMYAFCAHLEPSYVGSVRFANNDWSEVAILMGLVDQVLSLVGDVAGVFTAWLTLVERSFDYYETDVFFNQLDIIPKDLWSSRVQWALNTNSVRLAALIQAFAEREGYPLSSDRKKEILPWLDRLVDLGDRRSSALQCSRLFI